MPVQDPLFEDMPTDLREMISKPIGDLEENRPLLPVCHLFGECIDVVTGLSSQKHTRYFGFICQPREFGPDVTPQMQQALNGVDLSDYEFPKRERLGMGLPAGQIWWTPSAQGMAREFLTDMGFPITKPVDECIVEMRGKKVLMGIGKDSYDRGDGSKPREYNVMVSLSRDPR